MSGLLEVPELGLPKPTTCQASGSHSPVPVRFVWHHIQPQEAGGLTVPENLAHVCDNCHYTIHRIMWVLRCQKLGAAVPDGWETLPPAPPRRAQAVLAVQGFTACQAAGTVARIPNEG